MSQTPSTARTDWDAWRIDSRRNPYEHDLHLRALLRRRLTTARFQAIDAAGLRFGRRMVDDVAPLVAAAEANPPRLDRYDGAGHRTESVVYSAEHAAAGEVLWEAGLVAHAAEPGGSFEQAVLGYLASHEGEMGHMCAATCTTGLIRALRRAGDRRVRHSYLPALAARDRSAWRGAQFLTEAQGGSDVGANVAAAVPRGDGAYRISGEKWFCSVAEADVFLVMARPSGAATGTAGLGCFVVPRLVDGGVNGFTIRRLKDKLGTRSMASAEIDFVDAIGWPVGPVDDGFRTMVTAMLNTSRWLNAVGDVGIMRRAVIEATAYARHRRAFGRRIGSYGAVRSRVAGMKAEWLAALHSTIALTALDEQVDVAIGDGTDVDAEAAATYRFLVNANKLACSQAATSVVRDGIEILGGNGAIETFSVLPRLLRDAIVYEQWEGTHNVLAAQVRRDLERLGTAGTVIEGVTRLLKGIGDADGGAVAERTVAAVETIGAGIERCVADPAYGEWHFRRLLERLMASFQAAQLLETARTADDERVARETTAAADLLVAEHVDGVGAAADETLVATVDAVLGDDLDVEGH